MTANYISAQTIWHSEKDLKKHQSDGRQRTRPFLANKENFE